MSPPISDPDLEPQPQNGAEESSGAGSAPRHCRMTIGEAANDNRQRQRHFSVLLSVIGAVGATLFWLLT